MSTEVALPEEFEPGEVVLAPVDPATIGWPALFPVELAMAEATPREICDAYGISKERFTKLLQLPAFQAAYKAAQEQLAKDGASFRIKARMQSEEYLKTAFAMVHSIHTPATVKADLIKTTFRVAGLEPKEGNGSGGAQNLQINIHL